MRITLFFSCFEDFAKDKIYLFSVISIPCFMFEFEDLIVHKTELMNN